MNRQASLQLQMAKAARIDIPRQNIDIIPIGLKEELL
jgi:hypothetical protein